MCEGHALSVALFGPSALPSEKAEGGQHELECGERIYLAELDVSRKLPCSTRIPIPGGIKVRLEAWRGPATCLRSHSL